MLQLATKYIRVLDWQQWLLLELVEQFVNGSLIQIGRIERSERTMKANLHAHRSPDPATSTRRFLDAHFYFICIGLVNKCLRRLCGILNNAELTKIQAAFENEFKQEIRNDLEHLDERAVGKKLGKDVDAAEVRKWMGDFVGFKNDKLSFGGKPYPVNKATAQRLRELYGQVIAVIHEGYAAKDANFVEQEAQEEIIRRATRRVRATMRRAARRRS